MALSRLGYDIQAGRLLIGPLKIDITGDKIILHHQDRIDQLAGARHPHLMASLALCRCHRHPIITKHSSDRLGLTTVANQGRGGMGTSTLGVEI